NAYAAWTGTTAQAGNQDIFFSKYSLTTTPFTDRFEPDNTSAKAIDLGKVTTQRIVPQLSLAGQDDDWFKVQAGASGLLIASAAAPAQGSGINVELWDSTGTTLLVTGVALTSNGQITGEQASVAATANQVFLVHVFGSGVPSYSLAVQALTADLG